MAGRQESPSKLKSLVLKKSKEQTGGCGTLSLQVSGDPLPERLKYEYQQSTSKGEKVGQMGWLHTNEVTEGPTFTIHGLQPAATGGSLHVRVRWPTAKDWSDWNTTTFRKWEGSAPKDDVEDGVEDDAAAAAEEEEEDEEEEEEEKEKEEEEER